MMIKLVRDKVEEGKVLNEARWKHDLDVQRRQKRKQEMKDEMANVFMALEQEKDARMQSQYNAMSPIEYQMNKDKLNSLGYSPENKNIILKSKYQ